MKAKEKVFMKYVLSVLLSCAMVTPLVSQRVKVDPPQRHHVSKKTESKSEKCNVKDCKCVCHKKATHRKSDRRDSKRGDKRGGRVIRGRSSKGTRSRRSRPTGKISAEYESKLRERLKGAVRSGKIKKEQADKLLKDRFGRKEVKKDTDNRRQWLNINSNERKQWGEILKRRLQGNRHYTDSKK
tara:strand:+ start:140 stop:691 length:552 start_codon:yes stop_codon:yes gene_type:complete